MEAYGSEENRDPVFDPDLKFIGEEDAYQGLEFISRWTEYGTFQIFVDKLTKQMKVGNYIMLDNDRKKTGIIKRIECSDEEESGVPITISGYTLLHLLTQRITYRLQVLHTTASTNLQRTSSAVWSQQML